MNGGKIAALPALAWLAFSLAGGPAAAKTARPATNGAVPPRNDGAVPPRNDGAAPPRKDGANGLWRKAIEIQSRNREWYPERVVILSEMLNRRGEPSSVTEMFFRLRLDPQGRVRAELERARKNGEDTTEKTRSKVTIRPPEEGMDPDDENTYSVSLSDSPFVAARQDAVDVVATSERQFLFGRRCRRFDFTYRTAIVHKGKPEELTWRGMAWLEEGSGTPVKLEFTLLPLPGLVRRLWTIYLYDLTRPERWLLKKVSITGHGGFLFIKKRFRTTTTFSEYRRPHEPGGRE